MTRCQNQATKCKFRDGTDVGERLIEQLIIGTKHKKVQERLLSKGESLMLDEAMDVFRTYEAMFTQIEKKALLTELNARCVGKLTIGPEFVVQGGSHKVCHDKREPREVVQSKKNTEWGAKEKTANNKDQQYKDINDEFETITQY